jgi:rare lipoprotein A
MDLAILFLDCIIKIFKIHITTLKYLLLLFLIQQQLAIAQLLVDRPNYLSDTASKGYGLYYKKGIASYYHRKFEGRRTSNGERYRRKLLTAAHRTLPFNTKVKITNPKNKKWVIVRINDRGPYHRKRLIDVSEKAAKHLGLLKQHGLCKVVVEEVPDSVNIWMSHPPEKK